MLFPVGYAIIYSFTDFRLGKSAKFIGLENYISIFQDSEFSQRPGLYTYTYFSCGIKSVVNRNDISITFGNIHHFKKPISNYDLYSLFHNSSCNGCYFQMDVYVKLGNY